MNVQSRSGSFHSSRALNMNSRIGLPHPIHSSLEGCVHFRPDDGGDPLTVGPTFAHCPAHKRFGPNHDHTRVVVSVSILFGVVVEKPERLTQEKNIVRLAG